MPPSSPRKLPVRVSVNTSLAFRVNVIVVRERKYHPSIMAEKIRRPDVVGSPEGTAVVERSFPLLLNLDCQRNELDHEDLLGLNGALVGQKHARIGFFILPTSLS